MNLKKAIQIITENNHADCHGAIRPHNQSYMNKAIEILVHFAKANSICKHDVFIPAGIELDRED